MSQSEIFALGEQLNEEITLTMSHSGNSAEDGGAKSGEATTGPTRPKR